MPISRSETTISAYTRATRASMLTSSTAGLARSSRNSFSFSRARRPDRNPAQSSPRTTVGTPIPGFFEGPPDAAFEVISPGDTYSEIEEKTLDWLRACVRAVVVVDPRTESVRIHRAAGAMTVAGIVDIEDVIPGWRLPLSEIFDR